MCIWNKHIFSDSRLMKISKKGVIYFHVEDGMTKGEGRVTQPLTKFYLAAQQHLHYYSYIRVGSKKSDEMYYDYLRETYEYHEKPTRNLRVPRETYEYHEKPTRNLRVPRETYEKPTSTTRNLRETYEKPTRNLRETYQFLCIFRVIKCHIRLR